MVARLLKLIVLYICIDESVRHPNTGPIFLEHGLLKDLDQLQSSFFRYCSYSKLWVQNWLKFASGKYNVCEAMSNFIKKLRHIVR